MSEAILDVVPVIGDMTVYAMSSYNANEVNARRKDANDRLPWYHALKPGAQMHKGNPVTAGDCFPMMITRVWGVAPTSAVNGQVFLDGNDTLWVTSVVQGDGEGKFHFLA